MGSIVEVDISLLDRFKLIFFIHVLNCLTRTIEHLGSKILEKGLRVVLRHQFLLYFLYKFLLFFEIVIKLYFLRLHSFDLLV